VNKPKQNKQQKLKRKQNKDGNKIKTKQNMNKTKHKTKQTKQNKTTK
jgi:hypothetical protein